ncbi:MAG: histidine phosphatase family protein [Klenkia sp.]|nr:histidine phosphatase family protein [Klenkia sp.]
MARLILVRHGQTTSNVAHALDTGSPGAALTDLGELQAERLVDVLAHEQVDVLAASPLLRAQQTAAPLARARGLAVVTVDALREIPAGDLEMDTSPAAWQQYMDVVTAWTTSDLVPVLPGGRSGADVLADADAAVEELTSGGGCTVAVSHGALIRAWVAARAVDVDAVAVGARELANTGVVVLDAGEGGWHLSSWRDPDGPDEQPAADGRDAGAPTPPDA